MATFLFDKIIFGPLKSRRLGTSLGINLLPLDKKVCNFNCVYCECGWTETMASKIVLPSPATIRRALDNELSQMRAENLALNTITFAGNGEPTMHPDFAQMVDITIALRNQYFPTAKVAVLSNASFIRKTAVFNALQKVDQNILKLDAGSQATCMAINKPNQRFQLASLVKYMKKFNGNLIIQTLFLKGNDNNIFFNNASEKELNAWLEIIQEMKPKQVMIYSLERDTPARNLEKITKKDLDKIAKKIMALNIEVQVSS